MKTSDYIIERLSREGIKYIFGYIGGMITHLVDSINNNPEVEMINTITEQGAGFAAEGYARYCNKLGVAISTSGPGATNLLTAIASCYFDSVPVLFITGQVNTTEYQKFKNIRQNGFQEINIVDIARPVLKYVNQITDVNNLKYELKKAISIAQSGRKGPVLLDIPMDIQRSNIEICNLESDINHHNQITKDCNLDVIYSRLKNAKRPILLVGGGCRLSNATDQLKEFLFKTQIPVVKSLMGLDSVSSDYKYNLGFIGGYGNRYGNFALYNADLLLVIGSRLDLKQTGANLDFLRKKTVIHVDIDKNELEKADVEKIKIHMDASEFLKEFTAKIAQLDIENWRKQLLVWREKYPSTQKNDKQNIPNTIVAKISNFLKDDDVIAVDVGQHQMWVAQAFRIQKNQRLLFSGGLGSMGFALPCAIGTSFLSKRAIVISGDGGFQMNIQELEIIKRRNLPIKIIVMNNQSLGLVRQFQEMYFNSRCPSTVEDYSVPSFEKVASAYGIEAYTKKTDELNDNFLKDFFYNDNPSLLDLILDNSTQVEPKMLFGNTLINMSPSYPKKK